MSHYIHHVSGRLRIKHPVIKGNHEAGEVIRKTLSTLNGIVTIYINFTTGSIIIHYDPNILHYKDIITILQKHGYVNVTKASANGGHSRMLSSKAGRIAGEVVFSILLDRTLGGPFGSIVSVLIKAVAKS